MAFPQVGRQPLDGLLLFVVERAAVHKVLTMRRNPFSKTTTQGETHGKRIRSAIKGGEPLLPPSSFCLLSRINRFHTYTGHLTCLDRADADGFEHQRFNVLGPNLRASLHQSVPELVECYFPGSGSHPVHLPICQLFRNDSEYRRGQRVG